MSTILTASRWIELPTATGASDPLATDEPLGAGTMQVASSNALWAAQRNNLRPLWEHPGSDNIGADLGFDDRPDSFPWDTDPAAADAPLVLFAGVHRIRPYGAGQRLPRAVLAFRHMAQPTFETGVILVARPAMGRPSPTDLYDTKVTTATTMTAGVITLALDAAHLGRSVVQPRLGSTSPAPVPPESGAYSSVAFYVGAWRTGTGKATLAGITLYLIEPS